MNFVFLSLIKKTKLIENKDDQCLLFRNWCFDPSKLRSREVCDDFYQSKNPNNVPSVQQAEMQHLLLRSWDSIQQVRDSSIEPIHQKHCESPTSSQSLEILIASTLSSSWILATNGKMSGREESLKLGWYPLITFSSLVRTDHSNLYQCSWTRMLFQKRSQCIYWIALLCHSQ